MPREVGIISHRLAPAAVCTLNATTLSTAIFPRVSGLSGPPKTPKGLPKKSLNYLLDALVRGGSGGF